MAPPNAEQWDADACTIDLPATAATQRVLHESVGHLYDELATVREESDGDTGLSDELFEQIEELYVATAEESVASVELAYELEERYTSE
ncbi:hypothetical protein GS429_12820 [Natronorubrum sp. JWXQ-INN-674]|uniref:Uncharacterized protein n=1 Tax=Natronorubrum halalkaliphilum TaxID=2691917 RepID=A0A6B0VN16_9EURY|nr:hypothetical protein [Natronorubrum halalkaliphilum]MXV62934.1 hypothetical protein [Natronorubrum halalkaliphilum]